jgi:hypothetical protein
VTVPTALGFAGARRCQAGFRPEEIALVHAGCRVTPAAGVVTQVCLSPEPISAAGLQPQEIRELRPWYTSPASRVTRAAPLCAGFTIDLSNTKLDGV